MQIFPRMIVIESLAFAMFMFSGGPSRSYAAEVITLDVIRPTRQLPRHDHQLIFPLQDDKLLLVWSEYYRKDAPQRRLKQRDDMPCRISAMVSANRGRTWGPSYVLQENTGKLNVKHPNLLRLPSGKILFFFTQWNSHTERTIFMRRSADDAKTWSEPVRVSTLPGINNINNDHVLRLRSGRIVLPSFNTPSIWDENDHCQAFCHYSDDDGQNWQISIQKMDLPKRGAEEPSIVERKDGSLLALLRTSLGAVYQAESLDGGQTWSDPRTTTLMAPASPPLVKRIPSTGDLLAIWNRNYQPAHHHQGERTPLSAAVSRDDGATWQHIQDIERVPGGAAAYAAVHFQGDEALVTYYYQQEGLSGGSGVRLKIIPIEWFYQ